MTCADAVVIAALGFLAGCGTRATPTSPAPVAEAITIVVASDILIVSQSAKASATIALSNGTQRADAVAWSVDNPAVATIDRDGVIRALLPGTVTVRAAAEQVSGALTLRIVPDYRGRWEGRLELVSCRGVVFRACAGFPLEGEYRLAIDLRQERDEVIGSYHIASVPPYGYSLSVPTNRRGELRGRLLQGDGLAAAGEDSLPRDAQTRSGISEWRSELAADGAMEGGFQWTEVYPPASERGSLEVRFKVAALHRVTE